MSLIIAILQNKSALELDLIQNASVSIFTMSIINKDFQRNSILPASHAIVNIIGNNFSLIFHIYYFSTYLIIK